MTTRERRSAPIGREPAELDASALRPALAGLLVLLLSLPAAAGAQTTGGLVAGQASIPKGTKVFVLKVPDGVESDGKIGTGSGAAVVSALRQELLGRGMTPFTSDDDTLADGLKRAATRSDDYVLRTRIIMWEDNLTEWSMTRDKLTLSLELFDISGRLVSSATQQKNGGALFGTRGTPQRLVPEAARLALDRLLKGAPGAPVAVAPVPSGPPTASAAPPPPAMTNDDVVKLVTAGIGDDVVIAKIKSARAAFRLDVDDIVALKKAGVSDAVLAVMLEVLKKSPRVAFRGRPGWRLDLRTVGVEGKEGLRCLPVGGGPEGS
jgi:hypothetical protein